MLSGHWNSSDLLAATPAIPSSLQLRGTTHRAVPDSERLKLGCVNLQSLNTFKSSPSRSCHFSSSLSRYLSHTHPHSGTSLHLVSLKGCDAAPPDIVIHCFSQPYTVTKAGRVSTGRGRAIRAGHVITTSPPSDCSSQWDCCCLLVLASGETERTRRNTDLH